MEPCAEEVVIRLLGGFGVTVDARDIPDPAWTGRRARELVQLLALADRHEMLRDQVIDSLWPHLDVDAAAANLRKAAHHARQALGDPDAVVLQGGRVSLFPARSVEVESTDEGAYQELMRQALAAGARSEAIRWYGRLRSALARELGVTPDAVSERLYQECIAGVVAAPPDFVGRQLELATVTSVLRAATGARPAAILVRGPVGIGKSAFCHQVTRLAGDEGFDTLTVDVTDGAEPYAPLTAAIERLVVADRDLVDAVGAQTRSVLAALTPLAAPADGRDGPLNRHQVIGAFRRVLVASSRPRPILVVVDDAHAADESSLDALIQLAGAGAPVVVALAYRPESAPRTLERGAARLQRADRAAVIDLGPLDEADAATLVRAAAGSEPAPGIVDRIVELGAGNPFATLELARTTGADDLGALPRSVSEAITARLVDLDDDTVSVLRRIALASDDLDSATVVALTGSTEEQAFAVLDLALGAGVLVVADGRYRFRHALVRQALVDQVALGLAPQGGRGGRPAATRIALASDPAEALHVVEEAEESVRGALETCPGCRTFAVPAAIASARAGDFDRVAEYEPAADFLASVVMRLPAWNAAREEVRGHIARARGDHPEAAQRFRAAADGFGAAGHPLDRERCFELAAAGSGGRV